MKTRILLDAGAGGDGGGGGAAGAGGAAGSGGSAKPFDMATIIPDEFREHPSLKSIKTPQDLVKSYVNAQSLVGVDKIQKPNDKWTQKDWDAFYENVGRPKTAGDYKFDLGDAKLDDTKMETVKKLMHEQGLTSKQAQALLKFYVDDTKSVMTNAELQIEKAREASVQSLKNEWGPTYDNKMEIALSVVQKFASDPLKAMLNDSKWGDNPDMVRFFYSVGEAIMEDKSSGGGSGLITTSQAQAEQEIKSLKADTGFVTVLYNEDAPGHKEAVERWQMLHRRAYPTK